MMDPPSSWAARQTPPETPTPTHELDENYISDSSVQQSINPTISESDPPIVAVIGVGYVGLHLVEVFGTEYPVIGFDISAKRLKTVAKELDPQLAKNVTLTTDEKELAVATHYLVAVPTLVLVHSKKIDTSYLQSAIATVKAYARPGATIVMESSVAVGMTRQLLGDLMKERNIKGGMSPERVDPGRTEPPVSAIPKVISGFDDIIPGSLASIQSLYSKVFDTVVPVSKPEVAEMMKLYENCQRMMAIAYVNEMADACIPHGINPYEVAEAAATKPFGYLPFTPSLGVGGHCIPVNPYYLLHNNEFPLLKAATEKMWERPNQIADSAMRKLLATKGEVLLERKPCVLVCGVGFKRGQAVTAHSPGVALVRHLLEKWDAHVTYADPYVEEASVPFIPRLNDSKEWTKERLEEFDLIVVSHKNDIVDWSVLDKLEGVQVEMWCKA